MNTSPQSQTKPDYPALLTKVRRLPEFEKYTVEHEPGKFRKQTNGNTSPLVLTVTGLYDHKSEKLVKTLHQIGVENNLIDAGHGKKNSKAEWLYGKSSSAPPDRDVIKKYFAGRGIEITDSLIDEIGLRVNRYKQELSIVVPMKNTSGQIIQLQKIIIDPKTYQKAIKKFVDKANGRDRGVYLKRGSHLATFEGIEDALTWAFKNPDDSILVTFGTSGFNLINSFIKPFNGNVTLFLDPDEDNQSLKKSHCLGAEIKRTIPRLECGLDANKALQQGRLDEWIQSLGSVEWEDVGQAKAQDGGERLKSRDGITLDEKVDEDEPGIDPAKFKNTDLGNGERLIYYFGHKLKYCHHFKSWMIWTGKQWEPDESEKVKLYAKSTARFIFEKEAANETNMDNRQKLAAFACKSEKMSNINAMLEAGRILKPVVPSDLDQNKWLLNCNNGTVDLKNGELKEHDKRDLITKIIPIDFKDNTECPTWKRFLLEIMGGDQDLVDYIQKAVGYSLTGETSEQCLFFLYGKGQNGKSTFINTVTKLLPGYYEKIGIETLKTKKNTSSGNASPDIAKLKGARIVVASEIEKRMRLNESLVKDMTGDEDLTARFLNQNQFTFKPEYKLFLYGNHKPIITGDDLGIWRRIKLIPFNVTVSEPDKTLPEKLKKELPGILNWAVEGCLKWLKEGIEPPEAVRLATNAYQDEMDTVGKFIQEECVHPSNQTERESAEFRVKVTEMFWCYEEWCAESGESELTKNAFKSAMEERGFLAKKKSGKVSYLGIRLKTPEEKAAEKKKDDEENIEKNSEVKPQTEKPQTGKIVNINQNNRTQYTDMAG